LLGALAVHIATYEDGSTATFYELAAPSGDAIELVFDEAPTIDPGTYVVVRGDWLDASKVHVSSMDVVPAPATATRRDLAVPHDQNEPLPTLKVAVLVLDPAYTVAAARKRLLDDVDSARNFYRENTYGAWNIDGDAFSVSGVDVSNCGSRYSTIATDARQAARTAGFDIDSYTQVAYYLPRTANCGWAGLGDVGKIPSRSATGPSYGKPARDSWYAGGLGCVVINQELGHNYGLQHGHLCTSPPYNGGCAGYKEYGDPFTPMGTGCGHLTAVEGGELNAFAPCNVIDVADGTYQIGPLETACTGPQVLRWKDPQAARRAEYVYLEYRRKIGHDNTTRVIEGVYVHYGAEYKDTSVLSWQTPANGASDFIVPAGGSATNAALVAGKSWTAVGGAVFNVVSLGETATIQVSNSGKASGATCLDATPAPTAPPVCCATGTCAPAPDGGALDAGRPDTGGSGGGDSGTRDTGSVAPADAATEAQGSGGAGGGGGTTGAPGSAGATGVGGAIGGSSGSAGAGGSSSSGPPGTGARPRAASDAVGGCSCRLAQDDGDASRHAWTALWALAALPLRRCRRARGQRLGGP
jgi:MYXO-CTERM domain-containing protein